KVGDRYRPYISAVAYLFDPLGRPVAALSADVDQIQPPHAVRAGGKIETAVAVQVAGVDIVAEQLIEAGALLLLYPTPVPLVEEDDRAIRDEGDRAQPLLAPLFGGRIAYPGTFAQRQHVELAVTVPVHHLDRPRREAAGVGTLTRHLVVDTLGP